MSCLSLNRNLVVSVLAFCRYEPFKFVCENLHSFLPKISSFSFLPRFWFPLGSRVQPRQYPNCQDSDWNPEPCLGTQLKYKPIYVRRVRVIGVRDYTEIFASFYCSCVFENGLKGNSKINKLKDCSPSNVSSIVSGKVAKRQNYYMRWPFRTPSHQKPPY